MRKLDISKYEYTAVNSDGNSVTVSKEAFDPKIMLLTVLFNTAAKLGPTEVLRNSPIGEKIENASGISVLLEEAEWEAVKDTLSRLDGYGIAWVKMIERIYSAPQVPVEEKRD